MLFSGMLSVLNTFGMKDKAISYFLFNSPRIPTYIFCKTVIKQPNLTFLKVSLIQNIGPSFLARIILVFFESHNK